MYEREYTLAALNAIEPWLFLLPSDVQRKVKLARRTKGIVDRYGEDVRCY